jgi:hypothetical protein
MEYANGVDTHDSGNESEEAKLVTCIKKARAMHEVAWSSWVGGIIILEET